MKRALPSTPDPITAERGAELSIHLEGAGWRIVQRFETGLEWWAAEMWIVESVWTPQGRTAYITFLTDPQYETYGPRVWALGLASAQPLSRADAESVGTFVVRHSWRRELASLIECLAALRTR
jgi:hypothetical protein